MSTQPCPDCGADLPTGFLGGMCPHCLLDAGQASNGDGEELASIGQEETAPVFPIPATEQPGQRIGSYKLLEPIGEGGFGTVWMAEQLEPTRRKVALKIIKLGMDTREVVARFEGERQALALMNHPHIARVMDGGITGTGRPYFAMELVYGLPIHRFCDAERLEIRERVALLIDVCQAVQHAHQKGIIHRDLKPSNILVAQEAGRRVPKIIDFGIAKAIGTELTDKTLFTRYNQVLGTPAYMSPEQCVFGAVDIDTRTDIYSLGAILFELLVGHSPHEKDGPEGTGLAGMWRDARNARSATPSSQLLAMDFEELNAVAERRRSKVEPLRAMVRGDLDWITIKALETDRTRRYESASAFALDLQRYLANEPVLARPPSLGYRAHKFVGKYRVAVGVAIAFIGVLLLAVVVSVLLALRANQERKQALAAQESESVRRREAQEAREKLRRRIYVSDMGLVQDALQANNLARAQDLLLRHRPAPGESDLRHWEWRYLWKNSRIRARTTLPKQDKPIRSLAISRNGQSLAWGGEGGMIGLWDLSEGRTRTILETGAGDPAVVSFSPTRDMLAASVKRGMIKLWEEKDWSESTSLSQEGWTRALGFSSNGRYLACMSDAKTVSLWLPGQTNRVKQIPIGVLKDNHKGRMAFDWQESRLAIGETDGTVRMLGLPGLEERQSFPAVLNFGRGGSDGITAITFSPDDQLLVTASGYNDFAIRLWRPADGSPAGELPGHAGWVTGLAWSPDGKTLASASVDQTVRLWDWETRTERAVLRGHQHEVSSIAFSPAGQILASGSRAGEIFLWDSSAPAPQVDPSVVEGRFVRQAAFSPDSTMVAAWHWDGSISLRSADNLPGERTLATLGTNNYGALFSPLGKILAVGNRNGSIALFDLAEGKVRSVVSIDEPGRILPVAYSRDASILLGVARDTAVPKCYSWEVRTGRKLAAWPVSRNNHRTAMTGDGRLVATGDFDGTVKLWDTASGQERAALGIHQTEVLGLQFSPDDQVLASGSYSGDVMLWNVRTHALLGTLRGQAGAIYSLSFSPDGQRLVTGGNWQRAIQIWDLRTHQLITTLPARGAVHENVLFSPDGNSLLSVNSDGALHLWNAQTLPGIDSRLDP